MLSDTRGIFALAAIDHRDSLGIAFEKAGHETPSPERIADLKVTIARALAPHATGLLVDVELGAPPSRPAPPARARSSCRSRRRATRMSRPGA